MRRSDRTTEGPPCIVSNVLQTSLEYGEGSKTAPNPCLAHSQVG